MRIYWSGLRVRLLGLVLLALLPGLAFFLYNASEQRHQSVAHNQQDALRLARLAAANQKYLIEGARFLLITLSQLPAVRNQDAAGCSMYMSNLLAQYAPYSNFGAVDRDGNIFCMGRELKRPVNISDRAYFQGATQRREFAVGDFQVSRSNELSVITFGYPVFDGAGKVQGIVFVGLDLHWLNQFIVDASLPEGADLCVIDRNGIIIAHYPRPEEIGHAMPESSIMSRVLGGKEGVAEGADAQGADRLYAFTPLYASAEPDAYVVISIPSLVAFRNSETNFIRDLAALAVGAILALSAAWLASGRFVLNQVTALLNATRRLSAGDLSARTGKAQGSHELVQLASAFDEMAETLEEREAESRRHQEQIQRQTERAETLARVARRLNTHLNLPSVLDAIYEETSRALNIQAGLVNLYTDGNSLSNAGRFGLLKECTDAIEPVSCTAHQVAGEGDVVTVCPDVSAVPDLANRQVYAQFNFHTALCADLLHEGHRIGNVILFSTEQRQFSPEDLALLQAIADEAAMAISNAQLYAALQQEERARTNLLHRVITAQENERMRIARELHDETGQSLSALLLGLDVGEIILKEDTDQAQAHLQDLKGIAERMLHDTHRLIADLRPSLLDDLGLVPAIAWYGDQRLGPLGITLHMNEDAPEQRLPRSAETALFRIVQEGITNVIRHAGATEITVNLNRQDGHLSLQIADNGRGFDPRRLGVEADSGRGLGLRGMQERAEILGGEFNLESAPGEGTVVTVRVPISSEVAHE